MDDDCDAVYTFKDKKHKLYSLVEKIWNIKDDSDITKKEWVLLDKYGYDSKSDTTDGCWEYEPLHEFLTKTAFLIYKESKVPKLVKEQPVLYGVECSHQCNELNQAFYDDYKEDKIGFFVFTKKELNRYKEDYCDAKGKVMTGTKNQ